MGGRSCVRTRIFPVFFLIIVPQAIRYQLLTVGFMVQIIKGTSLAYIISSMTLWLLGKDGLTLQ